VRRGPGGGSREVPREWRGAVCKVRRETRCRRLISRCYPGLPACLSAHLVLSYSPTRYYSLLLGAIWIVSDLEFRRSRTANGETTVADLSILNER